MGVTLPSGLDQALDLIGISWPNVDEDDYRDMAQAMREFADDIDNGAADAQAAITDLVGVNEGLAVEALERHWNMVKGTHLANLAEAGRLTATALDGVAVLIEGAKVAAIAQLAILAAEVAAAIAAAPVTFGLSTAAIAGATQITRVAVKRIFQEVCEQIAEQVISTAMGPAFEALGSMAGDLVVQLGGDAPGQTTRAGQQGRSEGTGGAKSGRGGAMQLAGVNGSGSSGSSGSSGGSGGGGAGGSGGQFSMDVDSYDRAGTQLTAAGGKLRDGAGGKLSRAKSSHGRTKGKDPIADAANGMLDQVMEGIERGVKRSASHLDENMTGGLKKMAKNHRDNDDETALSLAQLKEKRTGVIDRKTPIYLIDDDGKVTRLRSSGEHQDLDHKDRNRIGVVFDGDKAGRAQEGEETLKLSPLRRAGGARPLTESTRVELGSTPLSRAVQLARHTQESYGNHAKDKDKKDLFTSNNYAAARFDGKDRGDFIMVGRSSGFRHSERNLAFPFLRDGEQGRMKELYTERAPCSSAPNCSAWMKERLPKVDVTHSIEYGDTKESRGQGNKEMMDYLDRLKANRNK